MVLEVGFDSLHFPLRSFWCTEVMFFIFFMVYSRSTQPQPGPHSSRTTREGVEGSTGALRRLAFEFPKSSNHCAMGLSERGVKTKQV